MLSTMTTSDIAGAYDCYRTDIYRFLLRRMRNHHDAEELTQQAFADALRFLPGSDAPRSMRGWLFTVAERRSVDELRRRQRAAETLKLLVPPSSDGVDTTDPALADALARLSELEQSIVLLRIVEGRSYRDIARAFGRSEAACRTRVSRALRRLRRELAA
jgi:RNA polymerase sigma-70 factor, ECF subfamily